MIWQLAYRYSVLPSAQSVNKLFCADVRVHVCVAVCHETSLTLCIVTA